jgi:hypothetical protein
MWYGQPMSELIGGTIQQEIDGWVVEMTWADGATQTGPATLTIRPKDLENVPAGGLSSTVLRQIDFRAGATMLRELTGVTEWIKEGQAKGPKPMDMVREALSEGISDDYLSLLAIEYVGRVNAGQDKPVDRIAEGLGKSLGTVKGHLWQARKRGLLEGGSAGRKGGQLTERASDLAEDWWIRHNPPETSR